MPLSIAIALVFAVLLNKKIKYRAVYRTIFFIPMVITPVAIAMVWQWLYDAEYGLINNVFGYGGTLTAKGALMIDPTGELKAGIPFVHLRVMLEEENMQIDRLLGHGGLFKTPEVGQRIMATAVNIPVSVMETASEGGAWGIALLAQYMAEKSNGETLESYLQNKVFENIKLTTVTPTEKETQAFSQHLYGEETLKKLQCSY